MKRFWILCAGLLASCSTQHLTTDNTDAIGKFNQYAGLHAGTIYLKSGTTIQHVKGIRISGDQALWADSISGRGEVKLSDIRRVIFVDRSKGANTGLSIGAGVSTALITVAVVDAVTVNDNSDDKETSLSSKSLSAAYLIFGGATLGALIGFIKGFEFTYYLD